MEDNKQIVVKLIFTAPSVLSLVSAVYSFFYWADIISKMFCFHLMSVSMLPILLEFSPYFREYIMGSFTSKLEGSYAKISLLLYISVLVAIIGIGVLGFITATIDIIASCALLIYEFRHKITEKLGLKLALPSIEQI
ncbi:hypothetical protein SteCoe_18545 [Stentor coeruleus]|uniref:Uncharacterized protein n=1 Tax=Stentor coeruleus TaxID=5963 RepID=A0A1R2BW81_9CILI|nr:hypothetical protein SteCoe_18545 [Stentor coeruleus]